MCSLLLIGALFGLAVPDWETRAPELLQTTLVAQPTLATSPRPRLRAAQEVGGKLSLGNWRFPIGPGDPPRVSTDPLGKPELRLRDGKRIEFRLGSGEEQREVQVLFEKRADRWLYGTQP